MARPDLVDVQVSDASTARRSGLVRSVEDASTRLLKKFPKIITL